VQETPIVCPQKTVDPAWIDYNGHMNMAYYNLIFDQCVDYVYDNIGIGAEYARTTGGSCFTLEIHVNYLQELVLGDPVRVTFQLLDWDAKRLHYYEEMFHAEKGYLAATSEQLALHVNMESRRSAAFPQHIQEKLSQLMADHASLPRDERVGQIMGIRRK